MMPNKTIYVAEADLPIFEKAQELAGGNLSATIAQALKRFVEIEGGKPEGFRTVTIKVGRGGNYQTKQFSGRLLAKYRSSEREQTMVHVYEMYQTAKGKLALYSRKRPNWSALGANKGWEDEEGLNQWHGEQWYSADSEYRLNVYETLEESKDDIPEELYEATDRALRGETIEVLDI